MSPFVFIGGPLDRQTRQLDVARHTYRIFDRGEDGGDVVYRSESCKWDAGPPIVFYVLEGMSTADVLRRLLHVYAHGALAD